MSGGPDGGAAASLDLAAVRAQFASLRRNELAFLDAPAGSQVPDAVIDEECGYILNLGIEFKGGTRIDSMKKLLLENYDAIGAFRAQDAGAAIDPSGELNAAEKFQGPVDLAKLLATKKQEDYTRCLVEKLLTYALGRGLEHYDRTAVKNVADGLAKRKNTFSGLVLEVVNSVPFQKRRGEGDAHAAAK